MVLRYIVNLTFTWNSRQTARGGHTVQQRRYRRAKPCLSQPEPVAAQHGRADVADIGLQAASDAHQLFHQRSFANVRRGHAPREPTGTGSQHCGHVGHRYLQNRNSKQQSTADLCSFCYLSGTRELLQRGFCWLTFDYSYFHRTGTS